MELSADIEMCIGAFLFGLTASGAVFFKLAATLMIKRAMMRH